MSSGPKGRCSQCWVLVGNVTWTYPVSTADQSCQRSLQDAATGAHTTVVSFARVAELTLEKGSFWNPAPMISAQSGCSNSTDGGTIDLGSVYVYDSPRSL